MNIQELKEKLKQAMELKEYEQIEDIWLNLMELLPEDLVLFYSIADWLGKHKEKERAATLLLFLTEHFKKKNDFHKVLEILKKAAFFNLQDTDLRQELINCYQVLLSGHPQKEELISSGIKEKKDLAEILATFDHYLDFNIGQYFYRPEWGVGKIIDCYPLKKKRVVIDFEKKERHEMSIDAACEVLTKLDSNHFLVVKLTDMTRLKNMAPIELILFLLKSINQPLTPQKIRSYLQGIIPEEEWLSWWNKISLEMTKDGRVSSRGNPRTYLWCNQEEAENNLVIRFDKALPQEKMELAKEACEKGFPVKSQFLEALFELGSQSMANNPSLAIEIFLFVQDMKDEDFTEKCEAIIKTCEDLPDLLAKIQRPKYQLQTLKIIKTALAKIWPEIYVSLFFSLSGVRLLGTIIDELEQEKLDVITTRLYQLPQEYPEKFLLVCKKSFRNGLKLNLSEYELLSTLLKLLEKNETRVLRDQIKAFLLEDNLLRTHLSPTQLNIFCETLLQSGSLKPTERNKIRALTTKELRRNRPKKEENKHIHFYAIQENIDARRQELTHIMETQIPANIKEIAHARSYGDLRENFEYKSAKEQQKLLYAKLVKLRAQLAQIKVIRPEDITTERVNIGTKVKLKSLNEGVIKEYTLLGPWESDPDKGIISYLTAIGCSLFTKRVGDKVTISEAEWEIIGIDKGIEMK
ncbi:MAG: GreA/GreB family elongation factor [bacterium]|nr:GreA/GreB family elongation factor [bacterium]